MNTDEAPETRTSSSEDRGRRVRAGVVAAGAAAGLTLAGLGIAAAQTGTSTTPPTTSTPTTTPNAAAPNAPLPPKLHERGPGGHLGFGFGAIHGELTVPKPGGGYQTLAVQTGDVTAVSSSSLTVKSEDGFSRTYAVDDNTLVNAGNDGIADVKSGDTVHVTAVVDGSKSNAVDVVDVTNVKQLNERWRPPGKRGG